MSPESDAVTFKDLTLREGSQVPGFTISEQAGRAVLDDLASLGVGCVEVSFPRAHARKDWYRHAEDLGLRTAALSRAVPDDVDAALAVGPDEVEVIITASDLQLEYALGKSRDEARDLLVSNVERAADGGVHVGTTLMDAMRTGNDYLAELARAAVDAGAGHITLADTTGSGTPAAVTDAIETVTDAVGEEAFVAIHTHDDKGVATANAAVGVNAGSRRVDTTVGGIGERAGNAPLEEVAVFLGEDGHDVDLALDKLVPVCTRVHETLGVNIPPAKAVLGEHTYRHESGMHTAAMLREPSTYEAFDPSAYGARRKLLFGGDTGSGAVRALLADAGRDADDEAVADALDAIDAAAAEQGEPLSIDEARRVVDLG